MMLQYVTVFDPSRSTNEEDIHKQLLLYHSFTGSETTLQDKLSKIGVIQGIWSLTDSLNDGEKSCEKVIDLDAGVILTIKVESKFFICMSIARNESELAIPHQLYMSQMWYCYYFFTLNYGKLKNIEDTRKLTASLNEHFVSFWNDIVLRPEVIARRGITGLWPHSCKIAELEFNAEEESWESMVKQSILLETDSYLGIKDILVYHLPSQNSVVEHKKQIKLGYKTYGLVRHFSPDLEITNELSNWIYHKHAVYDFLSSHVLAGAAHYKEAFEGLDTSHESNNDFTTEAQSTGTQQSQTDFQLNLQKQGKVLLHNLTLPFTFAYDAVQEVSYTAGISKSMSLFMDYVPKWRKSGSDNPFTDDIDDSNNTNSRYGFLISPLCSQMLPTSYKVKSVKYYDKDTGDRKEYHLLFWYYGDVLAVIVCEPNFSKIWDTQYLQDLSYKLRLSMECFYRTAFKNPEIQGKENKKESFSYVVLKKDDKTIKSSLSPSHDISLQNDSVTPLELVVNGVDQLFGAANTHYYDDSGIRIRGLDMMGGIFGNKNTNKTEGSNNSRDLTNIYEKTYENFVDGLPQDKKWDLQLQILAFLKSFENSQKTRNIIEERLLKLNNGILCYIKENDDNLTVVLKNWYENEESYKSSKSLFMSLGVDVYNWWNSLSQ
ncbi:hypothetical protein HG535_0A01860 [Zygotorulaspora mrakii]|uniref:CCZ1/INTU/HSP4 first Longin domain-containing protein n=1 Tax=Zygotorulaspora mrakii TaxID=42260 RepID=A0A7H9AV98_ZYGMR|nr:uncharacterized protein HG535_0A01860 [Zygotorulaspora mrakii]QLG70248.1 hypothetical protein HG535_0A01860 [Zygotorulaspora mrakii]